MSTEDPWKMAGESLTRAANLYIGRKDPGGGHRIDSGLLDV
jgi:hypothetical protein